MLGTVVLGGQSDSGTGRLHWEESLRRPGVNVFMWHNLQKEEDKDKNKDKEDRDEEEKEEEDEEEEDKEEEKEGKDKD